MACLWEEKKTPGIWRVQFSTTLKPKKRKKIKRMLKNYSFETKEEAIEFIHKWEKTYKREGPDGVPYTPLNERREREY